MYADLAILQAKNLSVGYEKAVLEGVHFVLKGGEMLGVLGQNGAGKSTLLHTLAGLQAPISGAVMFEHQAMGDVRQHAHEIAYLEQAATCHWPMKVRDVVALGRLPHRGIFRAMTTEDKNAIEQAMKDADVHEMAERDVTQLSCGERTRVLLARALAVRPHLLLVDEPVAGLDPAHQLAVMQLLQQKAKDGISVVCVLHDLTLAARFCTRLLLLHEGKVLAEGRPEKVLTPSLVGKALGVEVFSGTHAAQPYVVPWAVLPQ